MDAVKSKEKSRIIEDSDPKLEEFWHAGIVEKEPEVLCIAGSYINSAVLKRLSCFDDSLTMTMWTDSHGDDRGPDHHDHSSKIRIDMEPVDINISNEFQDDYSFTLRSGLKFREEKNGMIVALSLNGFFVNCLGAQFIEHFRDEVNVSVREIKMMCERIGISKEAGLSFLRKLLLLGLVTSTQYE